MNEDVWALSPYKNIAHKMLNAGPANRDLRSYVIDQIKAPLMTAIVGYGERIGESELSHNGEILKEIGDQFLEYDGQIGIRQAMFRSGVMILLDRYEHPENISLPPGIVLYGFRYPKPTKENTDLFNTHTLLDTEAKFFETYPELDNRPFRAAFRILICEYHHDPYYRFRMDYWVERIAWHVLIGEWEQRDTWIDWLITELVEQARIGNWKPRNPGLPPYLWNEPRNNDFWGGRSLQELMTPFVGIGQ